MSTAKYIGRVGALAVALGVGIAVANTPGVALAEPADSSTSSPSDSHSSSSSSPESGSTASDTSSSGSSTPARDAPGRQRRPLNPPGGMAVSSSVGLTSSTAESSQRPRGFGLAGGEGQEDAFRVRPMWWRLPAARIPIHRRRVRPRQRKPRMPTGSSPSALIPEHGRLRRPDRRPAPRQRRGREPRLG